MVCCMRANTECTVTLDPRLLVVARGCIVLLFCAFFVVTHVTLTRSTTYVLARRIHSCLHHSSICSHCAFVLLNWQSPDALQPNSMIILPYTCVP